MKITAEKVLFNKVVRGSSPRRPTTFTNDFSKLSGVTQISQPPKPCVQLRINNKIAYKLRTNRKENMGVPRRGGGCLTFCHKFVTLDPNNRHQMAISDNI